LLVDDLAVNTNAKGAVEFGWLLPWRLNLKARPEVPLVIDKARVELDREHFGRS
jgi:hypothetical protein